ncbi:hypothetical protein QQF64_033537 [Cirrhinus molitorella]|uniref:Uncharacterized protein n=1 Tax=Cirrhinus molitorella TaxID=172907 RepID=A0ABR3MU64_9TELE
MPVSDSCVVQNDLESEWSRTQKSWKPQRFLSDVCVAVLRSSSSRANSNGKGGTEQVCVGRAWQNRADPFARASWHKPVNIVLLEHRVP